MSGSGTSGSSGDVAGTPTPQQHPRRMLKRLATKTPDSIAMSTPNSDLADLLALNEFSESQLSQVPDLLDAVQ
eukprot:6202598-Pyramimonas_sp.AAC.1